MSGNPVHPYYVLAHRCDEIVRAVGELAAVQPRPDFKVEIHVDAETWAALKNSTDLRLRVPITVNEIDYVRDAIRIHDVDIRPISAAKKELGI